MTHGYFQTVVGVEDTSASDATKLKWEFDEDSGHYYVSLSLMYYMGCVKITSLATLLTMRYASKSCFDTWEI